jgi:hypothetical protein
VAGRISDWQPFHLGGLEPGAGGDAGGGAGGAPADGLWFDPEAEQLPRGARVSGEPVLSFQGAGVLVKVVGAEASAAQALAWLQVGLCVTIFPRRRQGLGFRFQGLESFGRFRYCLVRGT